MLSLDKYLSWACFVLLAAVVTVSPWLFAAWEAWLFWPFVAVIFCSLLFFSIRLAAGRITLKTEVSGIADNALPQSEMLYISDLEARNRRLSVLLVASFIVFVGYACVRFLQSDVFMDAERSFLLFLTPFMVGVMVVFGFSRKQLRLMSFMVVVNLLLLGLYGIVNHFVDKSRHVLWRDGYDSYISESRATGSYFCPDHFSGLMELLLCLALGIVLTRGMGGRRRIIAGILGLVGFMGIVLSKSRGGGLTAVIIVGMVMVAGFLQWPVLVRWYWRAFIGGVMILLLFVFCSLESGYMVRFKEHFGWNQLRALPVKEVVAGVKARLAASCRGQMISAALRAWKTRPVFGIGAGMHQNVWPHFAASPDGDRENKVWPSMWNNTFHSYEVHSDWVQLLEEYGIVGLILFLMSFLSVLAVLFAGMRREIERRREWNWEETGNDHYHAVLGAVFSITALAFHSLGDFNLQMPATVWIMAVIVAIPMAYVLRVSVGAGGSLLSR